jgi:NAD(P)H-dependent flavin oxidoreductase YrpB (nitropropane dioxygenase family)
MDGKRERGSEENEENENENENDGENEKVAMGIESEDANKSGEANDGEENAISILTQNDRWCVREMYHEGVHQEAPQLWAEAHNVSATWI